LLAQPIVKPKPEWILRQKKESIMLEKIQIVDRIEVLENGSVQVRTKTAIMEDGKQISGNFHRHVVAPGDDYSAEDAKVKAICASIHTAEVIVAYQEKLAEQ
jgi:archaellum component FlaF (FlaF/FlaG flagellin family)